MPRSRWSIWTLAVVFIQQETTVSRCIFYDFDGKRTNPSCYVHLIFGHLCVTQTVQAESGEKCSDCQRKGVYFYFFGIWGTDTLEKDQRAIRLSSSLREFFFSTAVFEVIKDCKWGVLWQAFFKGVFTYASYLDISKHLFLIDAELNCDKINTSLESKMLMAEAEQSLTSV